MHSSSSRRLVKAFVAPPRPRRGKGKLGISQRSAGAGGIFATEQSDGIHPWDVSRDSSTSQERFSAEWVGRSELCVFRVLRSTPVLLCLCVASPIQALARVSRGRWSSSPQQQQQRASTPLRVAHLHGVKSGRDLEPSRGPQDQWVVDRFVLVVGCLVLQSRICFPLPLLHRCGFVAGFRFWIGWYGYCDRWSVMGCFSLLCASVVLAFVGSEMFWNHDVDLAYLRLNSARCGWFSFIAEKEIAWDVGFVVSVWISHILDCFAAHASLQFWIVLVCSLLT